MAKPNQLQHSKTLHKPMIANVGMNGFTEAADTASSDITTALTTALASAANDGSSVPLVVSSTRDDEGVVIDSNLKLQVYETDTLTPVAVAGNEVYGLLSHGGATYTMTYYSIVGGVETATDLPAGTYNLVVPYRYKFVDLPDTALITFESKYVGQDPATGAQVYQEVIAVTALNTLAAVTKTPEGGTMSLNVDGHIVSELGTAFSVTGKTITWVTANAYDLETTDFVVVKYSTYE